MGKENDMKKTMIAIALSVSLLAGCASNTALTEAQVMQNSPVLSEAKLLLQQAQNEQLSLYSPAQIKAAQLAYDNAFKIATSGKTDSNGGAQEAVSRVKAAIKQADEAKYVFDEVFTARDKALNVNADSLVPEQYNDAEKQLKKMLAWLELGEDERAKRDINELKNQYLALELNALKTNMLSVAEKALKDAKSKDLDDKTPILFAQAQDEYKLALDTLEADRSNTQRANVHSNKTITLIKRAQYVADIERYFVNADFSDEQRILWYQEQLATSLSPLVGEMDFDRPNKDVVSDARAAVLAQMSQVASLNDNNSSLNATLLTNEQAAKNRESELSKAKNEAVLSAQLELEQQRKAKQEDDERFSSIQSLFAEEEATVYRQIDNVLIRAQGFSFKPGSSEIDSSNFTLLNKISDAIGRFPNAKLVVSGHTDSTGSAGLNLTLSEERARTVANFLIQVGDIEAIRVTSNGFGKEKPVASNESVDGRAQNRRVEILIVN